jgi:hypothetical protein
MAVSLCLRHVSHCDICLDSVVDSGLERCRHIVLQANRMPLIHVVHERHPSQSIILSLDISQEQSDKQQGLHFDNSDNLESGEAN